MRKEHLVGSLCGLFLAAVACSSPNEASNAAVTQDAGGPPEPPAVTPSDAGAEAPAAPVRPEARKLVMLGGPVLASPVVVPLFFGDDPDRARTESLLASLPGSEYWKLLAEYGVGDITIASSVTIAPSAPVSYSLNDVETTIGGLLDGTHAPLPDGTQIYVLHLPKQTNVANTDGSPFCMAGGGYHQSSFGRAKDFAYAVVPHCSPRFDDYAITLTHELIEAATDPYPLTTPAWAGTDPGHAGFRGEIGDLCDFGGAVAGQGAPMFGTRVERVFSNARAAKGGDPCLPDLGLPYFDAAPVPQDDVVVDDMILGKVNGRGVRVARGEKKTVPLVLYADRDLPPWRIAAQVFSSGTLQPSSSLKVTVDHTTGKAGDPVSLAIERVAPSEGLGDVVFISSANASARWFDTLYVAE